MTIGSGFMKYYGILSVFMLIILIAIPGVTATEKQYDTIITSSTYEMKLGETFVIPAGYDFTLENFNYDPIYFKKSSWDPDDSSYTISGIKLTAIKKGTTIVTTTHFNGWKMCHHTHTTYIKIT